MLIIFSSFLAFSQIPDYYGSIDFNTTPENIKIQLSYLINDTHTTDLPYTSSSLDTWDAVRQTDENPSSINEVLLFYGYDDSDGDTETDYTRDKTLSCHTSSCSGLWTREHVFARSLATPSLTTDYPGPGTDVHNLRACDGDMNSTKSNRLFQDGSGNSHITPNGEWYPGDEWKGDVARIIMYMYLRYPTQCLANNTGYGENSFHPDMKDVFLNWNEQDPVSQYELQRNDILQSIQGNRNPFIDNPYLATLIWGGPEATDSWGVLSVAENASYQICVYPTAVHDFLYITKSTQEDLGIVIYNTNGQEIEMSLEDGILNVERLENGIYFLKVLTPRGNQNFKFIKY